MCRFAPPLRGNFLSKSVLDTSNLRQVEAASRKSSIAIAVSLTFAISSFQAFAEDFSSDRLYVSGTSDLSYETVKLVSTPETGWILQNKGSLTVNNKLSVEIQDTEGSQNAPYEIGGMFVSGGRLSSSETNVEISTGSDAERVYGASIQSDSNVNFLGRTQINIDFSSEDAAEYKGAYGVSLSDSQFSAENM